MRLLSVNLVMALVTAAVFTLYAQEALDANSESSPQVETPGQLLAEQVQDEEHGLPNAASDIGHIGPLPISNSMLVTWIVAAAIIIFARVATRKIQAVPTGLQNFWEWLVESLYLFLESILGSTLVKRTFWFLATIFIFIVFTNWFGLVPGVGTIGWGASGEHGFELMRPLLRGGNADLNMPLAMAMLFFVMWTVWALQSNGLKGFVLHIFGPKGGITGFVGAVMILIFIAVGFLEVISIFFRPIALTFRLYGNMFAGENVLESMSHLIQHPAWASAVFSVLLPIPFYFMELLVGFVQALVFMLLCAVFTAVICVHDEEHAEARH